jgi:hypothetical protein
MSSTPTPPQPSPSLDPVQLENLKQELRAQQNLPFGFLGGVAGMVLGAVLWAVLTALLDRQIGYMAIGVGFLVGLGVRLLGRGLSPAFGVVGAALSLAGVLAGNVIASALLASRELGVPFGDVLSILDLDLIVEIIKESFAGPIDLLFYALALYFGYRFSFRQITAKDLERAAGM